ncbi:haloacid dehalogenase-like hydrolase superfamily protein [Tanacetum coccineum]
MFQNMSSDYAETHMELSLLAGDYDAKRLIGNQLALLFYMFLALLINAINNILVGVLDGVEAFLLHYGDKKFVLFNSFVVAYLLQYLYHQGFIIACSGDTTCIENQWVIQGGYSSFKVLMWENNACELERLKSKLSQLYSNNLLKLSEPMEGLKEWLDAVCTARIPCDVVSILDRRIMVEILEKLWLMKYFQVVHLCKDIYEVKREVGIDVTKSSCLYSNYLEE